MPSFIHAINDSKEVGYSTESLKSDALSIKGRVNQDFGKEPKLTRIDS